MSGASGRAIVLIRWWSAVLAGALLILAVVAVNGHPTVFTDTDDYYALGKELVTAVGLGPPPPELSDADVKQAAIDAHMGHTQMASRSAIYGIFLYAIESAGTLWLMALAQAAMISWLMLLLWRVALPGASIFTGLVALAAVAVVSPLPFFAAFAMPDVFAGVVVIAAALLMIYGDRLGRLETWSIGALLTVALSVHTSHILIMLPLIVVAGGLLIWLKVGRREAAVRLASIAIAVAVALAANSAYGLMVRLKTGDQLRNQPFLSARVLADGPGRLYLRHACANGADYVLCAFKNKPLTDSEDILWSDLPKTGVFMRSDYPTRVRLEQQEMRFVAGTLAYAPFGQFVASMQNWGRQLVLVYVEDPIRNPVFYLTDPYWKQTNLPPVILRVADCGERGRSCPSRLTIPISRWYHGGTLIVATAVLGFAVWRLRRRTGHSDSHIDIDDDRRLVAVVMLFVAGILINAAVCGILSGPFPRYQSRIVWLVPAAAALLITRLRRGTPIGGSSATIT